MLFHIYAILNILNLISANMLFLIICLLIFYKGHMSTLGWAWKELHISFLLGCRMHLFGAIKKQMDLQR